MYQYGYYQHIFQIEVKMSKFFVRCSQLDYYYPRIHHLAAKRRNRLMRVGYTIRHEVQTQLKPHVEELIVHIWVILPVARDNLPTYQK